MEITLKNKINNISLQIGDKAYFITPGSSSTVPTAIGKIDAITEDNGFTVLTINNSTSTPTDDDFIMFSKNRVINNSSLLGYYAEVKLLNNSTEKAELFALGSEITQSSK